MDEGRILDLQSKTMVYAKFVTAVNLLSVATCIAKKFHLAGVAAAVSVAVGIRRRRRIMSQGRRENRKR